MKYSNHILHVDMDCFYAQVEENLHPEYQGRPIAVGGIEAGHGVLCTSNYKAREYGVKAAMPTAKALKLCPDLVLIKPNLTLYREISDKIFKIFYEYTQTVQAVSLDEAYLDLRSSSQYFDNPVEIAHEIKTKILQRTGLTASVGVSYNKFLAKLASDLLKPNGLTVISQNKIEPFLARFHVSKINGVGKVMEQKMKEHGIEFIADLQSKTKLDLVNLFGKFGADLYNYARGVDDRAVIADQARKSLSAEHTFYQNLSKKNELNEALEKVYSDFILRVEKKGITEIKSIFVKIKYSDFQSVSVEKKVGMTLSNFKKLFWQKYSGILPVRLIGIGVKIHSIEKENQLELIL